MAKKGNLSINSENMFPIIKKWLYSDHDIFYREVISNACDAITKIKKMDMMGEYELPEGYKPRVDIILNDKDKTIKIVDNGIGMTAEEVEEYINQVAFSGNTEQISNFHFHNGFQYSHICIVEGINILLIKDFLYIFKLSIITAIAVFIH